MQEIVEWIESVLLFNPKTAYATGAAALVLAAFLAVRTFLPAERAEWTFDKPSIAFEHTTRTMDTETSFDVPNERVSQYFRRSKTLLVGLANLQPDRDERLDFTAERRVSRDLIREARYLKQQPIDPRSRELMNDLERIMIELKNIEEHADLPNVEIIRSGIREENLLFKIRMAEAMYDSTGSFTMMDNP
jgi:hypothetical protein